MCNLRYTLFYIYFRLHAAIFDFSLTLMSSWTNIRPTMLFDAIYMRIPLKFHKYSICNFRFKCFQSPPFSFPVKLGSNFAQGDVAISSGDFGILKNIRNNVKVASKGDLRPMI